MKLSDLGEYVLEPGGEHDAGDDQGDEQQQPVHDPRPGGALAARAERAARRAGRAGEAAGQRGEAQYPAHPGDNKEMRNGAFRYYRSIYVIVTLLVIPLCNLALVVAMLSSFQLNFFRLLCRTMINDFTSFSLFFVTWILDLCSLQVLKVYVRVLRSVVSQVTANNS